MHFVQASTLNPIVVKMSTLASRCTNHFVIMITSGVASSEQGKSEGFDSCDRPSNLNLDSNRQFFRPCDREI